MAYSQRKTEFNENAYGMHLTIELQQWFRDQNDLDGIALPPTLREESELGYDMTIPRRWGILYLQFKVPEYIRGRNGKQYKAFGSPYFRFKVKTDKTMNGKVQHNILCDLEDQGQDVFYAAPAFLTSRELIYYAQYDGMYANSVFPSPSDLQHVAAGSQHCFAYTDSRDIRAFSEPGPMLSRGFEEMVGRVRQNIQDSEPVVLGEFLSDAVFRLQDVTKLAIEADLNFARWISLVSSSVGLLPMLVSTR